MDIVTASPTSTAAPTDALHARASGDEDSSASFDRALKQELTAASTPQALEPAAEAAGLSPQPVTPLDPAAFAALLATAGLPAATNPGVAAEPSLGWEATSQSGALAAAAEGAVAKPNTETLVLATTASATIAASASSVFTGGAGTGASVHDATLPMISGEPAATAAVPLQLALAQPASGGAAAVTQAMSAARTPSVARDAASTDTAPDAALPAGRDAPALGFDQRANGAHRLVPANTSEHRPSGGDGREPFAQDMATRDASLDASDAQLPAALGMSEVRVGASEAAPQPLHAPTAGDGIFSTASPQRPAPLAETYGIPVSARVDVPFEASGWKEAFQQRILWLVDGQQQSAELHVNPDHLGPIEVMLNLSEDGAHIAFASPHADVREAIESTLAELRSALADKGVSLGEAHVSADSSSAREHLAERMHQPARPTEADSASESSAPEAPVRPVVSRGLVDLFA